MKVAVLFSGGKDSTYASWIAEHQSWEIAALLSLRPEGVESLMFHYPNVDWTRLQGEAMGFPHRYADAGRDELSSLHKALASLIAEFGITGVVTGAVASDYQKSRIDNVCDSLGLKSFSPLWHKDPRALVDDLKKFGFKIILSGVGAAGLDESWLGQEMTTQRWDLLEKLSRKHGIHLAGEGGEYETFVLDAPHFKKRIEIDRTRTRWDGQSGYLIIEQASLRNKLSN